MIESFHLHQPDSVPAALALLAEHPEEARVLAGGSELILLLKMGLVSAKHVVNIKKIPGLAGLAYESGSRTLKIGALVTHRALEKSPVIREHYPLIAQMERRLANVRIRNVGTLAGNVSFAEPHADPGTLLLAYGARVKLKSAAGERVLTMGEFFVDYYQTALRSDELLTEIEVPKPAEHATGAYVRFCPGERPMAGVAAFLEWRSGACGGARVALGCVGPTPIRAEEVEAWTAGKGRDEILARAEELGGRAAAITQPLEDVSGTVEYKRQIVKTLVARALTSACQGDAGHA
ncbi:MAG TPA: xanthine dehydrogenase family protein subunit M [Candidatus Binatia bacterium]